ncbi:MAG: fumarate hydratase [Candidatus Omnitrophota bacterium]
MKIISAQKIREAVSQLCLEANVYLRKDVLAALKSAMLKETNSRAKKLLQAIIENAAVASKDKLAVCQDTGLPVVFLEVGQGVKINGDLKTAVHKGIEDGYKKGSFRNSVIEHPLERGQSGYHPGVIHYDIVNNNKLKITVLPKGFGAENKTQLKMFKPTAKIEEIKKFIIEVVRSAGADACPPYIVGVGIGGTADYACLLAKKALLKNIVHRPSSLPTGQAGIVHRLGKQLLNDINKLNIGPMGLGGRTTCLGVNVEMHPTHIAGLPVCVNLSCHALRSASKIV